MFNDEATALTLAALVNSAAEYPCAPSGVPRLVISVWPRPSAGPEALLPAARPLLSHQHTHPGDTVCVLADYQLLLSGGELAGHAEAVYDTAAALLALGVDPRNTSLCRESDIAPLPEIYWLLSCILRLPLAPQRPYEEGREHSLFLAALAVGLGATRLGLDPGAPGQSQSFVPLLREIERRLDPEHNPMQVFSQPARDWPHASEAAPELRSFDGRYRAVRHNPAFLRDVLSEGAWAASAISSQAKTRLREHLHLGDGGTRRS